MAEEEKNEQSTPPEETEDVPDTDIEAENDAEDNSSDKMIASDEKDEVAEAGKKPDQRRREGGTTPRGGSDSRRGGAPDRGRPRRGYFRKKVCRMCVNKINTLDYKDVDTLKRFITDRGKIMPRRMTGTCAKHQRVVSAAVKRARMVALLPFVEK